MRSSESTARCEEMESEECAAEDAGGAESEDAAKWEGEANDALDETD